MDWSRRRVVLGTLTTVGLAGCLDDGTGTTAESDDNSAGSDTSGETTPATSPESDGTAPTGTPEESTSEDDEEVTPDQGTDSTPAEAEETPTPPDDERDSEVFPGYEMTTVGVQTPEGEQLGWVRAAIADTTSLRYTGLSDTDSLPKNYGMLFVFDEIDDWTFVMREMDFGIDIVYADADGVITMIHHAPEPGPDEDGSEQRYPGRGQYVLEVNKHWTSERGVEEGDVLDFDLPD